MRESEHVVDAGMPWELPNISYSLPTSTSNGRTNSSNSNSKPRRWAQPTVSSMASWSDM